MGQTVYIDLFFLINFSMDFLCFFLTAKIMGGRLSLLRAVIASVIGGIYANVALFVNIPQMIAIILDLAVCMAMCLVVFGDSRGIVRNTLAYIAVSLVLGGFMTATFYLLNRLELPLDVVEPDGISAWVLAVLASLSAVGTMLVGRFFKRRSARSYTTVTVFLDGRNKAVRGFCDSGNLLRDPISGKPCIIVDREAIAELVPREILDAVSSVSGDLNGISDKGIWRRIRIIPTVSATGNGMLVALRADKILVGEGKHSTEVDALVGITALGKMSGECQALVPSELMI